MLVKRQQLKIWCNTTFNASATASLCAALEARGHSLHFSASASGAVLKEGRADEQLLLADVAFGQPAISDCLRSSSLAWVHVSTAGYARYDTEDFRENLLTRRVALTNSSSVFADSCAHHVLAMMLGAARQLNASLLAQVGDRAWGYETQRYACRVLTGTSVLMLGYGAIGRRLKELLAPFACKLYAVRRQTRSEAGVHILPVEDLSRVLPLADHVVNILPDNEATRGFMNARRLGSVKRGAWFYNIGRGSTLDARALIEQLESGRLAGAYLDVTDPEPPPFHDPLWSAPNCWLTPHIAGGRPDQDEALVAHFLANLDRFVCGEALLDRIL